MTMIGTDEQTRKCTYIYNYPNHGIHRELDIMYIIQCATRNTKVAKLIATWLEVHNQSPTKKTGHDPSVRSLSLAF